MSDDIWRVVYEWPPLGPLEEGWAYTNEVPPLGPPREWDGLMRYERVCGGAVVLMRTARQLLARGMREDEVREALKAVNDEIAERNARELDAWERERTSLNR